MPGPIDTPIKRVPVNIWDKHRDGHVVCVTTNGTVKPNGENIMGGGCALEANMRFPGLARALGTNIRQRGVHLCYFPMQRLLIFPTKYTIQQNASLDLIAQSARELVDWLSRFSTDARNMSKRIYLPSPGTGLGALRWEDVEPVLRTIFADEPRIVVTVMPTRERTHADFEKQYWRRG